MRMSSVCDSSDRRLRESQYCNCNWIQCPAESSGSVKSRGVGVVLMVVGWSVPAPGQGGWGQMTNDAVTASPVVLEKLPSEGS